MSALPPKADVADRAESLGDAAKRQLRHAEFLRYRRKAAPHVGARRFAFNSSSDRRDYSYFAAHCRLNSLASTGRRIFHRCTADISTLP